MAEAFNLDKSDSEKWKTSSVGRVIKRLGFQPKRMTGGRSGYIYDVKKISQLSERYDTPPSPIILHCLHPIHYLHLTAPTGADCLSNLFSRV